jgi:hypothetical protein
MKTVRLLALGLVVVGALTCAETVAQQPAAEPGQQSPNFYRNLQWSESPFYSSEAQAAPARLAQQYVKTEKEEERKEIRKKLAEMLAKQFDTRAQQQQKELEELEKQITQLRAVLKKRLDAKSTIIDRRIEQLIQEAEGLGWNAPGNPYTPSRSVYTDPLLTHPGNVKKN